MALPTTGTDRRRTPRTNLASLAYINFEPDNGGIVLNVSEEGLCFHAVAPVQRSATLPFSLSANGNCVEAVGLIAWTDEHRKIGGLRFDHLAPDARRQIRNLVLESSRPFAREKDLAVPVPRKQGPSERLPNPVPAAASGVTNALSRWVRAPLRWGDFSRGLTTGLLIALFVATGFSLDAHRRQIGSLLIRLGEHFESAPQHEAALNAASTPTPSAPATRAAPASTISSTSAQRAETLPPLPAVRAQPQVHSTLASTTPAPAPAPPPAASLPLSSATPAFAAPAPAATNASQRDAIASQPAASAPQLASLASPATLSNPPSVVAKAADQPGENEDAEDVVEINSGMPLGKYFDVGKFKDEFAASQIERSLTDLGFRTVVLPKSLLWMKSYNVLVGPYRNAQDAESASHSLQSHGYKPRSLPKRSRELTLAAPGMNPFIVFSEDKDTDNLIVTWETYSAQATVRFVKKGETVGAAVGKWVKLPGPSEYSAIEYIAGRTGKRTLLSIQFHGMKQAVTLPNSADRGIVF